MPSTTAAASRRRARSNGGNNNNNNNNPSSPPSGGIAGPLGGLAPRGGAFEELSRAVTAALFPGDDLTISREGFAALQSSPQFEAMAERASLEMLAAMLARQAGGAGGGGSGSRSRRGGGGGGVGSGGNNNQLTRSNADQRGDDSPSGLEPAAVDAAIRADLEAVAAEVERCSGGVGGSTTNANSSFDPSILLGLRHHMNPIGEGDYDRCEGVGQPPLLGGGGNNPATKGEGEACLVAAAAALARSGAVAAVAAANKNPGDSALAFEAWKPMERVVALWVGLRLGTDSISCYRGNAPATTIVAPPPPRRDAGSDDDDDDDAPSAAAAKSSTPPPSLARLALSAQALDDARAALEAMGMAHEDEDDQDEDEDENDDDGKKTTVRAPKWCTGAGKVAILLARMATLLLWGEADAIAAWAQTYGPSAPPPELWRALDALSSLARCLMASPVAGLDAAEALVLWSMKGRGRPRGPGAAQDFLLVQAAVQAVGAVVAVDDALQRARAQARFGGEEEEARIAAPPASSRRARRALIDLAQGVAAGAAAAFPASSGSGSGSSNPLASPAPSRCGRPSSSSSFSPDVGPGRGRDLAGSPAAAAANERSPLGATAAANNNADDEQTALLRATLKDDTPTSRPVITLASLAAQILPAEASQSPALLRKAAAMAGRALFVGLSRGVVQGGEEKTASSSSSSSAAKSAAAAAPASLGLAVLRLVYLWPTFYAKMGRNPLDPQDEDGDNPRPSPDQERLGLRCAAGAACRAALEFFASTDASGGKSTLAHLSPAARGLSASIFASGARKIVASYGHGSVLDRTKGGGGMRLMPVPLLESFISASKTGEKPQTALWRQASEAFEADFFPENEAEQHRRGYGRFSQNADDEEFHGDVVYVLTEQMREGYCGFAPPMSETSLALDAARLGHLLAFGAGEDEHDSSFAAVPIRARLAANDARSRAEAACLIGRRMLLMLPPAHAVGVQTALAAALLDYHLDPLFEACVAKRALYELGPAATLIRRRVAGGKPTTGENDGGSNNSSSGSSSHERLARRTRAFLRMEEQVRTGGRGAAGGGGGREEKAAAAAAAVAVTLAELKQAVFEFGFIPDVLALSDVAHAAVGTSGSGGGGGAEAASPGNGNDLVRPGAKVPSKQRRKICGFGNCPSHHEEPTDKRKVCGRCKTVSYCGIGCLETAASRHRLCCATIRAAKREAGTL